MGPEALVYKGNSYPNEIGGNHEKNIVIISRLCQEARLQASHISLLD